jgi:hypothetical protein
MKKIVLYLLAITAFIISCKDNSITKPKNLIERSKMIAIIHDLALLEGAKSQTGGTVKYPKPIEFIKNKYKVDSLTFAQSTQYYASDSKEYKKMYEEVKNQLKRESIKLNGGKPLPQDLNQPLVK